MFYEGTEKRLFINVNSINLLEFDDDFWQKLVAEAGADILSCINTPQITAYLLSESSLLIWKDKLLLITCGNTQLINAALFFQRHINHKHISQLIFHRHNALKPHLQATSFEQDTMRLKKCFNAPKQALKSDSQGNAFIYQNSEALLTPLQPMLQRIDMFHELQGAMITKLQSQPIAKQAILETLQINRFFPSLCIDHHSFEPKGYSLNALVGQDYLTIHLTPEKLSTYLSIESSLAGSQYDAFIAHIDTLFSPRRHTTMNAAFHYQQKTKGPIRKQYQPAH